MRKEKERIFPQNTDQEQGHRGEKVKSVPGEQQGDQSAWNVKITETEQPREWLQKRWAGPDPEGCCLLACGF